MGALGGSLELDYSEEPRNTALQHCSGLCGFDSSIFQKHTFAKLIDTIKIRAQHWSLSTV